MIQLAYQPAYDSYHTIFRILRLLTAIGTKSVQVEQIRILDFYLAFPHFLTSVAGYARQTKIFSNSKRSIYEEIPTKESLFTNMTPIQDAAIQTLCLENLVLLDDPFLMQAKVELRSSNVPTELSNVIVERNNAERSLIEFLTGTLLGIPLAGPNGLKHRTGLMEYRNDYV